EIERLNEIARPSGMLDQLDPNQTYTTKDVAKIARAPLLFAFNYHEWSNIARGWTTLLSGQGNATDKTKVMQSLVSTMERQLSSAGLLQATVGMAYRNALNMN